MKFKPKFILRRGVEEVIVKNHLEKALKAGKKLRVKLGIDPTAPDLHLGHAVLLRKLRQFQDSGHKAILIIGDITAQIGDPSGRDEKRKPLTAAQIKKNEKLYLKQAGKILDLKRLEVRHNSEWLKKLNLADILQLASKFTIPQLTQREDFQKRIKAGLEVGAHEQLYPLLQAYDSVKVQADLELGGRDQKLNLLAGRHLMEKLEMKPQDILITPLLEGTDGVKKMSKSYNNFIALDEKPNEMFGKIMSIPDSSIFKYFVTLTDKDISQKEINKDPRGAKILLAKTIVSRLYNRKAGDSAEKNFVRVFSRKEKPEKFTPLPFRASEASRRISIVDLLVKAGVGSKSDARRLIEQGGVKINGQAKTNINEVVEVKNGLELKIGKKRFFKVREN